MKNFFSLLLLAAIAIFSTGLNAQMAHKDNMAAKGGDAMMEKSETMMAKKEAMMSKAAPTTVALSQITGAYTTQSLHLTPGDYIFEVTNTEVDKGLGFYLQAADGSQVTNSGLGALAQKGETQQTGVVTLTEGSYEYSCPLNPTEKYSLTVGAPKVVSLSQVTGEYVEGEITLAPGQYIFEVTNSEVDKGVGFYLQASDDSQVNNSGLGALANKGETQRSGVVTLTAGTYKYSCPLNPTPHYTVTVK